MTRLLTFYETIKFDEFVKSLEMRFFVIPAKAGIQLFQDVLDPGFRRGDAPRDFLRDHQIYSSRKGTARQAVPLIQNNEKPFIRQGKIIQMLFF
jgi:hypothetical protein